VDFAGEDLVGMVAFPAKVTGKVVVHGGGEGSVDDGVGGVVVRVVILWAHGRPGDAAIKAPDCFSFCAEELFAEAGRGDA